MPVRLITSPDNARDCATTGQVLQPHLRISVWCTRYGPTGGYPNAAHNQQAASYNQPPAQPEGRGPGM